MQLCLMDFLSPFKSMISVRGSSCRAHSACSSYIHKGLCFQYPLLNK